MSTPEPLGNGYTIDRGHRGYVLYSPAGDPVCELAEFGDLDADLLAAIHRVGYDQGFRRGYASCKSQYVFPNPELQG